MVVSLGVPLQVVAGWGGAGTFRGTAYSGWVAGAEASDCGEGARIERNKGKLLNQEGKLLLPTLSLPLPLVTNLMWSSLQRKNVRRVQPIKADVMKVGLELRGNILPS